MQIKCTPLKMEHSWGFCLPGSQKRCFGYIYEAEKSRGGTKTKSLNNFRRNGMLFSQMGDLTKNYSTS